MNLVKNNIFIVVLFLFGLFLPSGIVKADDMQGYFPLNDSDKWVYEGTEGEQIISKEWRVEGKELVDGKETIKITDEHNSSRHLLVGSGSVSAHKDIDMGDGKIDEYLVFEPPLPLFVFNIEQEGAHKQEYAFTKYDESGNSKSTGKGIVEIKFEGRENVVVPAGEFADCLKITVVDSLEETDGMKDIFTRSVWFSKGVGKVKEIEVEEYTNPQENIQGEKSAREYNLKEAIINGMKYGNEKLDQVPAEE